MVPDGRQQIGLGYTGPLQGTVVRETEDAPTKMISSALCGSPDKPIGQVLVADERKLEVHVQTQLCSVLIGIPEPKIEQEEFLNARFTLPFGWRYFTSSLPQDVVTPGIEAYMRRFNYSIAGLTGLPFPVPIDIENIPRPDTGSGFCAGASQGGCDCNCGNWEIVRELPECAAECDPKWKSWSCGPYLETGLGDLDAETQRYKAEVSQLDVPENVWQPWVMVFSNSGPDIRSNMWEDLERYRAQHDPADLAAQRAEIEQEQAEREERASRYDGETLRYRDALRAAGYTEEEVKGLTEVFSISSPSMRQIYWNNIGS